MITQSILPKCQVTQTASAWDKQVTQADPQLFPGRRDRSCGERRHPRRPEGPTTRHLRGQSGAWHCRFSTPIL